MSYARVSVFMDDHTNSTELQAEHGLSFCVETKEANILFDTGPDGLFRKNASRMGIEIYGAEYIVLSHGHCDHSGGLAYAADAAPNAVFCIHPLSFESKFAYRKGSEIPVYAGAPPAAKKRLENPEMAGRIKYIENPEKIGGRHTVFPSGGRKSLPENWPFFIKDDKGNVVGPDAMKDELSLIIEGSYSSCLIVGCSHSTLPEIFSRAEKLSENPISTVIGGSHLNDAPESEIKEVAALFADRDIELYFGHCTGIKGFARLYKYLGDKLHNIFTGFQLELDL